MWLDRFYLRATLICYQLFLGVCHELNSTKPPPFLLMQYLLNNYNPAVIPIGGNQTLVNVTIDLSINQIIDVNEARQLITTYCWMRMFWKDYYMTWNASDFGDISSVHVPARQVWLPDILLLNSVEASNGDIPETDVVVYESDGSAKYLFPAVYHSSCSLDISFFPFDEQYCNLTFLSWTHAGNEIDIFNKLEDADMSYFVLHEEWILLDVKMVRVEQMYPCCDYPFPDVRVILHIRRKPLFYVFNLIAPSVVITVVALVGFFSPQTAHGEREERVTLGITTLLSMSVLLMMVSDEMPATSDTVPLIGMYYGALISIISVATVLSVLNLHIDDKGNHGKPVPLLVKKIFFGVLAVPVAVDIDREMMETPNKMVTGEIFFNNMSYEREVDDTNEKPVANGEIPHFALREVPTLGSELTDTLTKLADATRDLSRMYRVEGMHKRVKKEWQTIAKILDRYFLITSLFITLTLTMYLLLNTPNLDQRK